MAPISKDEDSRIFYHGAIKDLAKKFLDKTQTQVIFLGAGVSIDKNRTGLPSGLCLAEELAKEVEIDWHRAIPLSQIAFFYESIISRDSLNSALKERLSSAEPGPGEQRLTSGSLEQLIKLLNELQGNDCGQILVVTTNYDELFENAYHNLYDKYPERLIYRGGIDHLNKHENLYQGFQENDNAKTWQPRTDICLFKIHGCVSDAIGNNLVITDEDYINFMSNATSEDREKKHLPLHLEALLSKATILFLGYSLEDWNFRVFFKATGESNCVKKYAIQFSPPLETVKHPDQESAKRRALEKFWGKKGIDIINVEAEVFITDLLEKVMENKEAES